LRGGGTRSAGRLQYRQECRQRVTACFVGSRHEDTVGDTNVFDALDAIIAAIEDVRAAAVDRGRREAA
jgi:hypothetical protein